MKIGRRAEGRVKSTKPDKNSSKKDLLLFLVIAVAIVLIVWVYTIGRKAVQTVSVVMYADDIYKNQTITDSLLEEYQMLTGEFEKYAVQQEDGTLRRRIVLWDERGQLYGTFAAYPLQKQTIAMWGNTTSSRMDNSDTVLYTFPGKNIVTLDVGDTDLDSFKTFLEPGDRINVVALFTQESTIYEDDGYGNITSEKVETQRQEMMLTDVMLADLLNGNGDSILDIYQEYNMMSESMQSAMLSDDTWLQSVEPQTVLLALTPGEEELYYTYLNMDDVQFRISLPQRTE